MKKTAIFVFALVLTVTALTGCGCRNSKPMDTMPTTRPTAPSTTPTTQATQPTVDPTRDTIEDGNGPLPTNATAGTDGDTSGATEDTGLTGEGRARGGSGRNGSDGSGSGMNGSGANGSSGSNGSVG